MTAKKVWGIIFIVLGVGGILYGGNIYIEIYNYTNGIKNSGWFVPQDIQNMFQKIAQNQINEAYEMIFFYVGIGTFLASTGTNMLNSENEKEKKLQEMKDYILSYSNKNS